MSRHQRTGSAAFVGIACLLMVSARAQVGRPAVAAVPPGHFVFGQVVDGDTARPIAGALVTLQASGASEDGTPLLPASAGGTAPDPVPPQARLTDGEGRFVFRDVPAGLVAVRSQRPGYLPAQYGQRRPEGPSGRLEVGTPRVDITLRMWRYASISGRVLDDAGEPAVGVVVLALRSRIVRGTRRFASSGGLTGTTDDRGEYRLGQLAPGDYLVSVPSHVTTTPTSFAARYADAVRSSGSRAFLDDARAKGAPSSSGAAIRLASGQQIQINPRSPVTAIVGRGGQLSVYPTVYHPSVTAEDETRLLTLTSGQDLQGIDIARVLVPGRVVSGRAVGPDGPISGLGVTLTPAGAAAFSTSLGYVVAQTSTDADGAFEFPAVPPGSYILRATIVPRVSSLASGTTIRTGTSTLVSMGGDLGSGPPPAPAGRTFWSEMPLTVGNADVDAGTLTLAAGAHLTGRLRYEGTAEHLSPPRLARAFAVSLQPLDFTLPLGFTAARLDAQERFRTMSYPPGRYVVSVGLSAGPWRVKALLVGGRDVLDTGLELGTADIDNAELVLSDVRTRLTGTVRMPSPDAAAVVLIVPANYEAWLDNGRSARRTRTINVLAGGAFSIANLPEGDYLVTAFYADQSAEFEDAGELAALLRQAVRVTIAEGAQATVSLSVAPGRW